MTTRRFRKCFELAEVPNEWQLVRFTLDWDGRPLLLFVEGKPTTPDFHTDPEAWSRWYRTPPKAHHLVHWETGERRTIQFEQSQGLSTFHVQRFDGGWLLGERRGGQTTVYDAQGNTRFELNLGDASEDLQTTPQGLIWVSYFDEGVYGGSIGRQGLVCFDNAGTPLFKYADFAEQIALAVGAPAWHGRNFDALHYSIVTGDINQIEVPYRIRIREFSQMGPAAHQVADQFVTLIQRFERTGCPVSVTLENERS